MKISFVIPAYNEEKNIGVCLAAIQRSLLARDCVTEVIVVNNASTDNTRIIASLFPGVRVIDEHRKGIGWARHAGFLASTGDIIANIDADTIMTGKWFEKVFDEFTRDEKLLAISGPYIYYDTPWYVRFLTYVFYAIGCMFDKIGKFFGKTGSMLQGGNFVLRREAIEKIGGFDTSIELIGEDTNIGRQVNKIGKVVFTFKLPMYSSGRRFTGQGLVKTGISYTLSFLWINFLGKPFSNEHVDVRSN